MSDAAKYLEGLDQQLWIRRTGSDCRDYLVGNCHTFRGRMGAYCPKGDFGYSVSLHEIEEMSPESARWVAGFLAGNEPGPDDMFGPGIHDTPEEDPHWQRWRDALSEFRTTGAWPHAGWRHLIPFPPGMTLPAFVWALRGDEVWTWDGDAWVKADPQPARRFRLLEGTVCFERGHGESIGVSAVHWVCEDCGETDELVPGGFTLEEWERAQYEYVPEPS